MAEQGFLFAEMQLQTGDVIDCKGKRLFFRDIYNGMQFVQDHLKQNAKLKSKNCTQAGRL